MMPLCVLTLHHAIQGLPSAGWMAESAANRRKGMAIPLVPLQAKVPLQAGVPLQAIEPLQARAAKHSSKSNTRNMARGAGGRRRKFEFDV